jgi:hypothetical protein
MAGEQRLTRLSAQEILNMSIPVNPFGHEHVLTADANNVVTFPVKTNFFSLYSTIPLYISIPPNDATVAGPTRFFFEGGSRFTFVIDQRTTSLSITNASPGQTTTVYFILGN